MCIRDRFLAAILMIRGPPFRYRVQWRSSAGTDERMTVSALFLSYGLAPTWPLISEDEATQIETAADKTQRRDRDPILTEAIQKTIRDFRWYLQFEYVWLPPGQVVNAETNVHVSIMSHLRFSPVDRLTFQEMLAGNLMNLRRLAHEQEQSERYSLAEEAPCSTAPSSVAGTDTATQVSEVADESSRDVVEIVSHIVDLDSL